MRGLDALRQSISEAQTSFDRQSARHRRLHRRFQGALIALTAASTVVAGLGLILPEASGRTVQFAVLCLTAATSAVGAWAEGRRARELWAHEREVYYGLVDLRRELEFEAARGVLTEASLPSYFERLTGLLQGSTARWSGIVERSASGGPR